MRLLKLLKPNIWIRFHTWYGSIKKVHRRFVPQSASIPATHKNILNKKIHQSKKLKYKTTKILKVTKLISVSRTWTLGLNTCRVCQMSEYTCLKKFAIASDSLSIKISIFIRISCKHFYYWPVLGELHFDVSHVLFFLVLFLLLLLLLLSSLLTLPDIQVFRFFFEDFKKISSTADWAPIIIF